MSSSFKTVVTLICVGFLVLGGVVFFYFQIEKVNSELVATEREIVEVKEQQEQFRSIRESLENNSDDIEKLDSYIIPADEEPEFLTRVESIGSTTGATVSTASVSTRALDATDGTASSEDAKPLTEILELTVSIEGEWSEVYHSIALIDTLPLDMAVKSLQMTRKPAVVVADDDVGSRVVEGPKWEASMKLEVLKKLN